MSARPTTVHAPSSNGVNSRLQHVLTIGASQGAFVKGTFPALVPNKHAVNRLPTPDNATSVDTRQLKDAIANLKRTDPKQVYIATLKAALIKAIENMKDPDFEKIMEYRKKLLNGLSSDSEDSEDSEDETGAIISRVLAIHLGGVH